MKFWPDLDLIAICALLAICLLQSSLDKMKDYQGNLAWLTTHFEKTPFKNYVPQLLGAITALEFISALACLVAIPFVVMSNYPIVALTAMVLCTLTFLGLFAGQRIAKDYAGAATIVIYFFIAIWGTGDALAKVNYEIATKDMPEYPRQPPN